MTCQEDSRAVAVSQGVAPSDMQARCQSTIWVGQRGPPVGWWAFRLGLGVGCRRADSDNLTKLQLRATAGFSDRRSHTLSQAAGGVFGRRAGRIDTAAAALGLGATALCLQPPGPGRTRRPGRLARFGNGQPVAQPCFQTVERDLTVAGLRSGVIDDHAQLGTEPRNEPLPYLEFNVAGCCEINHGFDPGAGAVGVLSSGIARRARRIEAPHNRGGRHPSTGKQEHPVHATTLHACTLPPRIHAVVTVGLATANRAAP